MSQIRLKSRQYLIKKLNQCIKGKGIILLMELNEHVWLCLQRLTITEQSYQDISNKYNELQSAKSAVEKELRDLRLALESETLNRNQASEQSAELHGKFLGI
jgi:hypothetical protein